MFLITASSLFLIDLQLIWTHSSIGGSEGPLCWVLVFSTASYLQLTWTSCNRASLFRPQFNPSTVKVISWYSSIGCTCYLCRCISYFDSMAGSEVNIKHLDSMKTHSLSLSLSLSLSVLVSLSLSLSVSISLSLSFSLYIYMHVYVYVWLFHWQFYFYTSCNMLFVCIQFNGYNYSHLILTIPFYIVCLQRVK